MPWCFREDSAKQAMKKHGFVINLDDKGNEGSHWVAARRVNGTLLYADPFGLVLSGYPPKELQDMHLHNIVNRVAWQRPSTNYCGYYAYCFAKAMNKLDEDTSQKELEDALWQAIH